MPSTSAHVESARQVTAFPLSATVTAILARLGDTSIAGAPSPPPTSSSLSASSSPQCNGLSPHSFRSATQATTATAVADDRRVRLAYFSAVLQVTMHGCHQEGLVITPLRFHVSRSTVVETFPDYLHTVFRDARVLEDHSAAEGDSVAPAAPCGVACQRVREVLTRAERCHHDLRPHFGALKATLLLQAAVDPLVEGLIACDRSLYLQESGCAAQVVPVFDAALSPRNCAVVASKYATAPKRVPAVATAGL